MALDKRFLQAYEAYANAIFRYCFYRVHSRETAEELMQEAFTRTWEQIVNGKNIENVRAFLYTTARNLIIDFSRRKKPVSFDELMEKGFDWGEKEAKMRDTYIDGVDALKKLDELDEPYREAVFLRYVHDLRPREIAEVIGETTNVISVRISRGIQQLKKILNNENSN